MKLAITLLAALLIMPSCKKAPQPAKTPAKAAQVVEQAEPSAAAPSTEGQPATIQVGGDVRLPTVPTVSSASPLTLPQSPIPLPAAASAAQPQTTPPSDLHRELFNEVASEFFDFRWVKDDTNPHQIDMAAGELWLPDAARQFYGLPPDGWQETDLLKKAVAFVNAELERRRVAAVEKTADAQIPVHFRFDLSTVPAPYQPAVKRLIDAGHYIQELYRRQVARDSASALAAILEKGATAELTLLQRNVAPICGRYSPGPVCNLLPTFLPKPPVVMWPSDFTDKTLEEVKKGSTDQKTDPVLSPFTVVKPKDGGGFDGIPYAKAEEFAPLIESVAKILEEVAAMEGLDDGFKKQLVAQAAAFRSESPYPYFESDEAWGRAGGPVELTIGPYETYDDKFDVKAMFEFVLGLEEPNATALIQKFVPAIQDIEKGISGVLGADIYAARTMTDPPSVRVINVITATGDAKAGGGPAVAFNLPNIGPMTDRGRSKRIIMANHLKEKFPLAKAIASIALDDSQASLFDPQYVLYDVTLHELAHGLGPRPDVIVPIGEGKGLSGLALGEYASSLEEAKADVAGIWSIKILLGKQALTLDDVRKTYVAYVVGLFRQLRFGLGEAHGRGAAMQLNYLIEKGAVEPKGDKYTVNIMKMPDAITSLLAEIGRIQAKGDKAAAAALMDGYGKRQPQLLVSIIDRIGKAGIPRDIAPYYHVKE